jgi:uncharacterized repeat protein (TIGR02543 family)
MAVAANITDYNGAPVTGCKIFFANNKDMTDAQEVNVAKNAEGKYVHVFENLTPSTEYYFEVEITTAYGTTKRSGSAYTKAIPVEDTTATVTIVINGDIQGTTSQNVKVGKSLRTESLQLKKKGYTFGGWFLDAEYTKPYEIAPVETADDFTIYAKWIKNEAENTTTAPEITTEPVATTAPNTAPSGGCGGASKNAEPVLLGGGAIAAILGAAVGGKSAKKRKSEEE